MKRILAEPDVSRPRLALSALLVGTLSMAACASTGHTIRTPTGLQIETLKEGTGRRALSGQHAHIVETTRKQDGTVLFTNVGKTPIKFLIGGKQATDGMDEGVRGMRVGGRRRLVIPPQLARRSVYPDNLSPDDTLVIDVELVDVTPN